MLKLEDAVSWSSLRLIFEHTSVSAASGAL